MAAWLRLGDLGRRSLWFDEAWVAVGSLDGPFDVAHVRVTPLLFAGLVRVSATLFGRTEAAVRLPAAAFGLAAVVLAYFVARHLAGRGAGRFAAAIVGLLPIPVYFGKEVKAYSAEVFLAFAVAAIGIRLRRNPSSRLDWVALVSCVAIGSGLSPIAPVLVAGALVALYPGVRRAPDAWVASAAVSAVAALAWYRLVFVRQLATDPAVAAYWRLFYLPDGPPSALATATLRSALEAATFGLGTSLPHHIDSTTRLAPLAVVPMIAIGVALLLGAAFLLARGHGWFVGSTLVWHALIAGAAYAARYPYGPARIALVFLAPTSVLLAAAASGLAAIVPRALRPVAWVAAIVPLAWPLAGTWRENVSQPLEREELRPVLEYVFAHRTPEDLVWVSPGASGAFRFYVPRPDARTTVVGLPATDRPSLAAITAPGFDRLWLVFAHRWPVEQQRAFGTLRGVRRLDSIVATGAVAVLVAPASEAGR